LLAGLRKLAPPMAQISPSSIFPRVKVRVKKTSREKPKEFV